jgi:hypothetical protein
VGAGKFGHPRRLSGPIYVDGGFPIYLRGWRNFPSPACCAHAWICNSV